MVSIHDVVGGMGTYDCHHVGAQVRAHFDSGMLVAPRIVGDHYAR